MLDYFYKFATGTFKSGMNSEQVSGVFNDLMTSPVEMIIWLAIIVVFGFFVCSQSPSRILLCRTGDKPLHQSEEEGCWQRSPQGQAHPCRECWSRSKCWIRKYTAGALTNTLKNVTRVKVLNFQECWSSTLNTHSPCWLLLCSFKALSGRINNPLRLKLCKFVQCYIPIK